MAKETKEKVEKLEREYNVPLRKEFLKVPKYKRAKKAVTALKQFLSKHMKCDTIKVGPEINKAIWKRGIKYPPHHVKVKAIKTEENVVLVEVVGVEYVVKKKTEAQEKSKLEQAAEKLGMKAPKSKDAKAPEEKKVESKAEEAKEKEKPSEEVKKVEKEELKEIKKEPAKEEKVAEAKKDEEKHSPKAPHKDQDMTKHKENQ